MPKNGRPLLRTDVQCIDHAGNVVEPAPAIGKGADAGQHHAIGGRHRVGIARHNNRLIVPAFARSAFEGFRRRMQIARAVVDNGDAHRWAPGSGNKPMTSDADGGAATHRYGVVRPRLAMAARIGAGLFALSFGPCGKEAPLGHFRIFADHIAEQLAGGASSVQRQTEAPSKPISNASKKPASHCTVVGTPSSSRPAS